MNDLAPWDARPVFFSSTFRDFHAERDALRRRVLPDLEEWLRERRQVLEWVDLRTGVETVGEAEPEAKELKVLKVCLEEVDRCRPFLVVLLGDRYGWVPPPERLAAAAREAGYDGDLAGKSVTALEIEYGVLADPEQAARSFFYFREPLPYARMDEATACQYRDINPEAVARLADLKRRIRETIPPERVRTYKADWSPERGEVVGLDGFCEMVRRGLVEATCGVPKVTPATWQEEERRAFDEFVAHRGRNFVGREALVERLQNYLLGSTVADEVWGRCLVGESGAGKSSLFAHLWGRCAAADVVLLAHAAGMSPRAGRVGDMIRRWIGELAASLGEPDPQEGIESSEELDKLFTSLLGRIAAQKRVVVLVDALDQFEQTTRGRYLTWLPGFWPENARFLATSLPGQSAETLAGRKGVGVFYLPPIEPAEAGRILHATYGRYHHEANPDIVAALIAKSRPDGMLACGNPLWLELAAEELNLLDADDFARADTAYQGPPDERLHRLQLDIARRLPPAAEDLYTWMLERTEQVVSPILARAFASLIAISRAGWRESDFQALLPGATGVAWDPLTFATLRRYYRAHVFRRGDRDHWDFFHAQARAAVRRRYLPDTAVERRLHSLAADHLEQLPPDDPLHQSELMVHQIAAADRLRAARHFARDLTERQLAGATRALADHIVSEASAHPGNGPGWVLSLLTQEGLDRLARRRLCRRYQEDLLPALRDRTSVASQVSFLRGVEGSLAALSKEAPDDRELTRLAVENRLRTGDLLLAQQDFDAAGRTYRGADEILDRTFQREGGGDILLHRALAMCYRSQAKLHVGRGELGAALASQRESLKVFDRLQFSIDFSPEWNADKAVILEDMGDLFREQGDTALSRSAYSEALGILQGLVEYDTSNPQWKLRLAACQSTSACLVIREGDLIEAERMCRQAVEIMDRLAAEDPEDVRVAEALVLGRMNFGEVLQAQGTFAEALAAYQAGHAQAAALSERDCSHGVRQRNLSLTCGRMGDALCALERFDEALEAYRSALSYYAQSGLTSPSDAVNLGAHYHQQIGTILNTMGDFRGASAAYGSQVEVLEEIGKQRKNEEDLRKRIVAGISLGEMLGKAGELRQGLAALEASRAAAAQLVEGNVSNPAWQHLLAATHLLSGNLLVQSAEEQDAIEAYVAGCAILQRLTQLVPDKKACEVRPWRWTSNLPLLGQSQESLSCLALVGPFLLSSKPRSFSNC